MDKIIPLRQQITRIVLNNPQCAAANYNFVSSCFCDHINADTLDECEKCSIKFFCYTIARAERVDES